MAIIIEKRINLDAPIKLDSLCGFTFTTESEAHQFVVRCDQNGQELTLAGTISAKFVRADGNTVELVGTIEDGKAVVTLAQDCYNVYGRFQLAIFNTVGNTKLCIYACIGTVQRAQSGNLIDGGGIIPDVEDLIADIQAAVESIPPSYTTLLASVAGTYSASKTYSVGDYAWYNGTLYRCSTAISTAEAWTSAHWTAAVLGDDLSSLKSALSGMTTATASDVGKALKAKTVADGKVTEWEFGEAGGGDGIEESISDYYLSIEDTTAKAVKVSIELPYRSGGYTTAYIATAKQNLFDFSALESITNVTVSNGTITTSGSNRNWYTGTAFNSTTNTFPVEKISKLTFLKAGTYNLSATKVSGTGAVQIGYVGHDGTYTYVAAPSIVGSKGYTMTIPNDCFLCLSTSGGTSAFSNIQLISASSISTFEEYAGKRYIYDFGEPIYGGTVVIDKTGNIIITEKFNTSGETISVPNVYNISGNNPVYLLNEYTNIYAMYSSITVYISVGVKDYIDKTIAANNSFVRLHLMTYNVGRYSWGTTATPGLTEEQYQQYIIPWKRFIAGSECDVLTTQEDNRYMDSAQTHESADLYTMFNYSQLNYGDPCLRSKYPLKDAGTGTLVSSSRDYSYGTITVNGKDIFVVAVHLKNGAASQHYETRQAEYAELVTLVSTHEYYIVMGDFNCETNDTSEFANFTGAISMNGSAVCGRYWTYSSDESDYSDYDSATGEALDNIFVSPNIVVENYKALNVYSQLTSDHIPFVASVLIY